MGRLYHDAPPDSTYRLSAIVCYYGVHFVTYAWCQLGKVWRLYDDALVVTVGNWAELCKHCSLARHQPTLLFFERVSVQVEMQADMLIWQPESSNVGLLLSSALRVFGTGWQPTCWKRSMVLPPQPAFDH